MMKMMIKRRAVMTVLLFVFYLSNAFSQCHESFSVEQNGEITGIEPGADNYYRNLIIQDLALDRNVSFGEVSIRFDYRVKYEVDQCTPGHIEIRAVPVCLNCYPVYYRDFDVSGAISPHAADLVFHLVNPLGIATDSAIVSHLQSGQDNSLYTEISFPVDHSRENFRVEFHRALFYYSYESYDLFRTRILATDAYYAAVALADSILTWTATGFLSENGLPVLMPLKLWEIRRLMTHLKPSNFSGLNGGLRNDPAGLQEKYRQINRIANRYRGILDNHWRPRPLNASGARQRQAVKLWLDWFDHYHRVSYNSDFRFVGFMEQVSQPVFRNSDLASANACLSELAERHGPSVLHPGALLVDGLVERGRMFETASDQTRALQYYESAANLALLMHQPQARREARSLECSVRKDIVFSLLQISRLSLQKDNPQMAAQYNRRANEMLGSDGRNCIPRDSLERFEASMLKGFANRAGALVNTGEYRKALIYLLEIEDHSYRDPSYNLPDGFNTWMKTVRQGIYNEMIRKSAVLLSRDETVEAEQVFRQAVDMRLMGGYALDRHGEEATLEMKFRQARYDSYIDEGLLYSGRGEDDLALYYYNKAWALQHEKLARTDTDLAPLRKEAAGNVITGLLSEGRLKAWAFEFDAADEILRMIAGMLEEYGFTRGDDLWGRYTLLHDDIHARGCERARLNYDEMVSQMFMLKEEKKFSEALKMANKAVDHSMANLDCKIRDEEAWYQKIVLEPMALFEIKSTELTRLSRVSVPDFLQAYRDLQSYYYRNKLLDQGVVLPTLFEAVMAQEDTIFLAGMADQYLRWKDYAQAIKVLERMRDLEVPPAQVSSQQKKLGRALAARDARLSTSAKPWELLNDYVPDNKWYREFRQHYKWSWIDQTGYAIRYWPFIWKK